MPAPILPALATAHSHAFQRALRGDTQRPGPAGSDDFWSWRTAMYRLADSLTPATIHHISLVAYRELYRAGVRTVGEFHYVHHQPGGEPYADRCLLAEAVIAAARDAGLRIALLRVIYHRAGQGRAPEGAQRRFSDPSLDRALADIDTLRARHAGDPAVRIGVAPHSVRAVPPDWLPEIAAYAEKHALPVHMHVAEQPAEIAACLAETGKRPVELLAERGLLSPRFVAVTVAQSRNPLSQGFECRGAVVAVVAANMGQHLSRSVARVSGQLEGWGTMGRHAPQGFSPLPVI